jgi:hypothetical protein
MHPMTAIRTTGDERITVSALGEETVCLHVSDSTFGRLATVRLDHSQAAQLANALDRRLVDAAAGLSTSTDD